MKNPSVLKIGQAAKALGVSIDTLRRWEKAGKITAVRTPGGTRLYHVSALKEVNPSSVEHFQTSSLSTEELLRKTESQTVDNGGWKIGVEDRSWTIDNQSSNLHPQKSTLNPLSSIVNKLLIGSAVLSIITLLITSWITASYLTNPSQTREFFKNNVASGLFSPFQILAQEAVAVINPKKAKELGFIPPDTPPPITYPLKPVTSSNVLAVTAGLKFLEVNADTQINGSLSVRDSINGLSLEATPSASTLALISGGTSLTVTNDALLDQDVSTTSTPTFNTLNLSATKNQLVFQSGGPASTLTWTPTAARTLTLPDVTDTLVGKATTDTLTNKSISGSSNTLTNIPNSALSNNKVTVTAGTNMSGGGDVSLGSSVTLSLASSPAISGVLKLADGTAAAPALTFTDDTNTGLYRIGADKIGLITAGTATSGITIDSSGQVGIGTISPTTTLYVSGTGTITGNTTIGGTLAANGGTISTSASSLGFTDGTNTLFSIIDKGTYGFIRLSDKGATGDPSTCTAGDVYFNGTDGVFKACTTTDSWSNLTAGSSGITGYWNRSSTTLSPATAGDSVSLTGSITDTPATNTTALTLTGTNVSSANLAYFNAKNTSGTIFNITYGAAATLAGALTGQTIDLNNGQITDTAYSVTGLSTTLPTITADNAEGTVALKGVVVGFGNGSGINQTGAGALTYTAADLSMPALTQTAGTLTANGVLVTTPSSITTGGTANAINISATGVGAGTLNGLNIGTIIGSGGTEIALAIGTGWDSTLKVGSTTVLNGSGVAQVAAGGTNLTSYTAGDLIYASATTTLAQLAGGTGNNGKVLVVSSGLPSWGVMAGSSCSDCVVNDPTSSTTQTIAPTGQSTSALILRQTSTASPNSDIFAVTNSAGTTKYFYVDQNGTVSTGGTNSETLTLTPTTDTTALTLVGTNVATSKLAYFNSKNLSGTIFDVSYGAATTLTGNLIGYNIDLSANVTATGYSVTGEKITLPVATNTHTSGEKTYKGLVIAPTAGGGFNQNGVGGTTTFTGADVTIPALTQTAGTLTANGVLVTTPSSITTGGTANAINISATGVGAGTLNGINIGTITAGAGTETAINIAAGWDMGITLGDDLKVGLGSSAAYIEFDNQDTDEINFINARVGIGTATPGKTLDVTGDIRASAKIYIPTDGGEGIYSASGQIITYNGNLLLKNPLGVGNHIYIESQDFIYLAALSGDAPKLTVDTVQGRVGIMTTAPDKALEINSATGANLRLTYNDANGTADNYTDFSLSSTGALTLTGSAATLGASATAEKTFLTLTPGTVTLTAPTQVTSLMETSVFTGATLAADAALTVNKATTLSLTAPIDSTNVTLTDSSGLRILNTTSGAGTLTNQYGLYIEDMTAGTNDYGIAIEGADTAALWISSAADTTDAANGIAFGLSKDTNLYRSAANTLKTDDSFIADTDLTVNGNATLGNLNTADTLIGNLLTSSITSGATTQTAFSLATASLTTGEAVDITGTWAPTDGSDNEALDLNLTYTPTTLAGTFRGLDLNVTEGANALANTDYALKVTMDNSANTSTGTHSIYGGYFTAAGKTAGTTTAVGLYAEASGADTNLAAVFGTSARVYSSPADSTIMQFYGANGTTIVGNINNSGTSDSVSLSAPATTGRLFLNAGSSGSIRLGTDTRVNQVPFAVYNTDPDSATVAERIQLDFSSNLGRIFGMQGASGTARALAFGTNNTEAFRIDTSQHVGIGITTPGGLLDVSKALSGTPSTTGPYLSLSASTFTDNNTAESGTAASMVFNSIAAPTLAATNATVTTTAAATFYIAGAPTAGTNEIITNAYALWAVGNVRIGAGSLCVKSTNAACAGAVAGAIYATNTTVQAADVAENYVSSENLEPGDVVAPAGDGNDSAIIKSSGSYQKQVLGVISTNPGVTLNSDAVVDPIHPNLYPVALSGRVPVKVSTENGPIEVGDYLTSSSIPGVAMKATQPGQVIGKALEDFSGNTSDGGPAPGGDSSEVETSKILVFISPGFADPGDFFASLALDNSGNLIMPNIKVDKLTVASEIKVDGKLLIKDNPSSDLDGVASSAYTDLTQQVASASAEIASASAQIASAKSDLAKAQSDINDLKLTPPDILLATGSATLANLKVTSEATVSGMLVAYQAEIQDNFKVLGSSTLGNTLIAGDLTVDGTMSITGNSINAIGTELYLQNSPLAQGIDIFNGKIKIDKDGNIVAQGQIAASEVKTNKLTISNTPIATSSATLAASIGSGKIIAGQTSVNIDTSQASSTAKIFITPRTRIGTQTLVVDSVTPGTGFTVSLDHLIGQDVDFDWWIVETN